MQLGRYGPPQKYPIVPIPRNIGELPRDAILSTKRYVSWCPYLDGLSCARLNHRGDLIVQSYIFLHRKATANAGQWTSSCRHRSISLFPSLTITNPERLRCLRKAWFFRASQELMGQRFGGAASSQQEPF